MLIERGSEVGGGDVRTNVGTVARIVASQSLPDGRAFLVTVGTRRIRVTEWLEDEPYPRADGRGPGRRRQRPAALTRRRTRRCVGTARRSLALAAELGVEAGEATRDFGDDPSAGTSRSRR